MILRTTVMAVGFFLMAAGLTAHAGGKRDHSCSTTPGALNPETHKDGADLILSRDCQVGAGTYKLGNVHILEGGTLRFADANIDFWAANIVVEKGGSLLAGVDKNGTITPIANGVVTIHLYGADLTKQDPNTKGNGVTCRTDPERCGVPQAIWESNIDKSNDANHGLVDPTKARKVSALAKAVADEYEAAGGITDDYFYPYHPLPYSTGYFASKVLAVSYGGTLRLFGKKGACVTDCDNPRATGQSWVRLAKTIGPADTDNAKTLIVDAPVDWKKGDEIVVTTTDYLPGHSEVLTLAADANGTTITVTEQVKYVHNGARYPIPADAKSKLGLAFDSAETRASVGLLTRNIRIVSAGDDKDKDFPATDFYGGHLIVLQGFKAFQVQGVEFKQMGQGGRLGHYPIHFHHARKTKSKPTDPDTVFVKDSSINESMTRWIVLHGTQGVLLQRNVGWKSIGHGFYLEDGTETDNKLFANLGVFARAAVDNVQNPRKVPGILAAAGGPDIPAHTDYTNPTAFWIMNGWNDFEGNMAAGAGTCGACYWLLPGVNSGMSSGLRWESYASIQDGRFHTGRGGMAPLKSFVANFCSSAMMSVQTVGQLDPCQGVGRGDPNLSPVPNPLAITYSTEDYPRLENLRHPTRCQNNDLHADCSDQPPPCDRGQLGDCMVTVLDQYTTSFNWAPFPISAIWLRAQWYLLSNSVITDVQQAGVTFVTGGGYTASDVVPGHWALARKSVFIGHTQESNPYASDGGPFSPDGLKCALTNGHRRADYCLSIDEGISHQMANFGMYQRLFSVYDGPAFQDSNAYLNIKHREIGDCTPKVHKANFDERIITDGYCEPSNPATESAWLAGVVVGLPKAKNAQTGKDFCYMPNAAIGWKQPNGFYYPPALHSTNLYFKDVDTRHFVVTPFFWGENDTDKTRVQSEYCVWNDKIFSSFTDIDRQTVLNDDDGTLTGYRGTTVVNMDDFFHAPRHAVECRSENTSLSSPYQYVTTVVYPRCLTGAETCANWTKDCTNPGCSGVPLYRQDLLPNLDKDPKTGKPVDKAIRMMGQNNGQRSTLTVNNGSYYLDTAVDGSNNQFEESHTYYLFLIYATQDTEQTYRFYVGKDTGFDPATIQMVQANIEPGITEFDEKTLKSLPAGRAKLLDNGVVEVRLRVSDYPDIAAKFAAARQNKCQPASYCTWKADTKTCVDAAGSDAVCRWGGAHPECPAGGCIGIKFTLPGGFKTLEKPESVRPAAACIQQAFTDEDGKKVWDVAPTKVEDGTCPREAFIPDGDRIPDDFCK